MARLPYLSREDIVPEFQKIMDRPSNLNRVFGHSPACRVAHHRIATYLRSESSLNSRFRELATLEVGYLARAQYEWAHHIKIGMEMGVSRQDINNLIAFNEGKPAEIDPVTLGILRAAREMTLDGAVSNDTFEQLRSFLDNAQLVDLIATIAHYNGAVRLIASFQLDLEDGYQKYLDEFPLPSALPGDQSP